MADPVIQKKRLFRVGEVGFDGKVASSSDEWLLRIDQQISKEEVSGLWVTDPDLPQPKSSYKTAFGRPMVCSNVRIACVNTERFLWKAMVDWKDEEDDPPENQTQPTPTSASNDPIDWIPTVTRRPVTVSEPSQSMFYEGGYAGEAHDRYSADADADPPVRSPITNSAMIPFEDNLPPHQRKQSIYTVRWVRPTIPDGLLDLELKVNELPVVFHTTGFSEVWAAKTAKIESVQLTQTKWGTVKLWEIVIEILHDKDGHFVTVQDVGLTETYFAGETYGGSPVAACMHVKIKDNKGGQVPQPVLLNGSGKALDLCAGLSARYGKYRDFELVDFLEAPLIGDLVREEDDS